MHSIRWWLRIWVQMTLFCEVSVSLCQSHCQDDPKCTWRAARCSTSSQHGDGSDRLLAYRLSIAEHVVSVMTFRQWRSDDIVSVKVVAQLRGPYRSLNADSQGRIQGDLPLPMAYPVDPSWRVSHLLTRCSLSVKRTTCRKVVIFMPPLCLEFVVYWPRSTWSIMVLTSYDVRWSQLLPPRGRWAIGARLRRYRTWFACCSRPFSFFISDVQLGFSGPFSS